MEKRFESMQLRAPAKINLSFRILHRRADGYHEIETLMALVSLFDVITLTPVTAKGAVKFTCDDPSLPGGHDNLVVRAAQAFLSATGAGGGVQIHLEKKIPHGAGLGGGSSDAATVLLGLSRLFKTDTGIEYLRQLAAGISSDVAFFLFESVAICRGRGEIVTPAAVREKLPLLLLKPAFGVSTPWAYSRWKDSHQLPDIAYAPQRFRGTEFVNDLECPVFEKHVFLAHMKSWLLAQREVGAAMLSGSGSTIFAALHDGANAEAIAARARAELDPELWTCACETL